MILGSSGDLGEQWFKILRGKEEPEEKEKLIEKSIQEWDRGFRKREVMGSPFGMEALTLGRNVPFWLWCH